MDRDSVRLCVFLSPPFDSIDSDAAQTLIFDVLQAMILHLSSRLPSLRLATNGSPRPTLGYALSSPLRSLPLGSN